MVVGAHMHSVPAEAVAAPLDVKPETQVVFTTRELSNRSVMYQGSQHSKAITPEGVCLRYCIEAQNFETEVGPRSTRSDSGARTLTSSARRTSSQCQWSAFGLLTHSSHCTHARTSKFSWSASHSATQNAHDGRASGSLASPLCRTSWGPRTLDTCMPVVLGARTTGPHQASQLYSLAPSGLLREPPDKRQRRLRE